MLLSSLYYNLDVLLNADGTDIYFGIDDFNRIIVDEQINFMGDILAEEKNKATDKQILRNKLRVTANSGSSSIPLTNFLEVEDGYFTPASGHPKHAELITWGDRYRIGDNLLAPPIDQNYMVYVYVSSSIHYANFIPGNGSGSYTIIYFEKPTTPFLDYYMNTTGELLFIPASTNLTTLTGTYRDNTSLPKAGTSTTVELALPDEYHQRFMERMIDRLSVKDRDQLAMSYAMQKDKEDSVKQ